MVQLDAIKVGGETVATGLQGIVDSGTSLLVGNADTIGKVIAKTGGATTPVACDDTSKPDITFVIEGKEYNLTETDYILKATMLGQTQCMPGLQSMKLPDRMAKMVILGDVFMRKYMTHFDMDNNRVGMALAKH